MEFCIDGDESFRILLNGQTILIHTNDDPLFNVGKCESSYKMHLGHFKIEHKILKKSPVKIKSIKEIKVNEIYSILFDDQDKLFNIKLKFIFNNNCLKIEFPLTNKLNYIRSIIEGEQIINCQENNFDNENNDQIYLCFSLKSFSFSKEEIRGCGLQFEGDNLRGKVIPIWVSEWYHHQLYDNDNDHDDNKITNQLLNPSYHPQPMFISSRGYKLTVYGSAYALFDFSNEYFHEFNLYDIPYRLEIDLNNRSNLYPLYGLLPQWIHNGIILSIQGGNNIIEQNLTNMCSYGANVAGVWAQDWCGKRITSFGKRVFWNWQSNEDLYPNLKDKIIYWKRKYDDCRFLGYINPYIAIDGSLFEEANQFNYLVKRLDSKDKIYIIDFGQFNGAIVDLTNPNAFIWYKQIIKKNLIDIGLSGWMADFGEYLPTDVYLYANISGSLIHNLWPILWAKCNYEAIRDDGKLNEIIFFMRSGYLNIQRYCQIFWTGDQSVDFNEESGLSAGIRSSLSLSLSNILCIHTDIGGYFSRTAIRTPELLLRWCEFETFNIIMRTHEGNRPTSNTQFYTDQFTMKFFSRMSRIHKLLKPYARHVLEKCSQQQISTITPHNKYQYFLGEDLFIAPVIQEEVNQWNVNIPNGQWIHIWTNKIFQNNQYKIDAPIGYPPVFYRSTTKWKTLFQSIQFY